MSGPTKIITLGSAFSGSGLVKLQPDPILVPNGSLCLIEPAHPNNPDLAGLSGSALATALATLYTDGTSFVGNVAHALAAAFMSVTDDNGLKGLYHHVSTLAGSVGKAERSGLGGLHAILTQSAWTTGAPYQGVDIPSDVLTYMAANSAHTYYMSQWGRVTRAALAPAATGIDNSLQIYKNAGSPVTLGGLAMFGNADANVYPQPADGAHRLGINESGLNVVGPLYISVAAVPSQPLVVGDFAGLGDKVICGAGRSTGTTGSASASYDNKWKSYLWYRTYIEDLTASGRSYATVDAIENALFQRHVNTAGGRYFGDTFTAPSTIP